MNEFLHSTFVVLLLLAGFFLSFVASIALTEKKIRREWERKIDDHEKNKNEKI